VRRRSWPVFVARLVEVVAALALVAAVLAAGGPARLVPWLLAGPGLVNTGYLRRLAVRSRPVPLCEAETMVLPRVVVEPDEAAAMPSLADALFALGARH
jgi:hypothetical protein